MTLGTLSLELMPQHPSPIHFVPPTRNDRHTLFQLLFDEYFNPPQSVDHLVPEVAVPEPVVLTSTPSSTYVDQDVPSSRVLINSSKFFDCLAAEDARVINQL
ncbi:hypothetical protein Tco_0449822 [Tanacetum coccineum]